MCRVRFFMKICAILFVCHLIKCIESSPLQQNESVNNHTTSSSVVETGPFEKKDFDEKAYVLSPHMQIFGDQYRAFCNTTADCQHDELICYRNRCRPNLNCRTGRCGGLRKWITTDNCTATNSCNVKKCQSNEDCPKNQKCLADQCSGVKRSGKQSVSEEKGSNLNTSDQINGIPIPRPTQGRRLKTPKTTTRKPMEELQLESEERTTTTTRKPMEELQLESEKVREDVSLEFEA